MNVVWTVGDKGRGLRPSLVHWAPGIAEERVTRGGFPLACSRQAPYDYVATISQTDDPLTCKICMREKARQDRRAAAQQEARVG